MRRLCVYLSSGRSTYVGRPRLAVVPRREGASASDVFTDKVSKIQNGQVVELEMMKVEPVEITEATKKAAARSEAAPPFWRGAPPVAAAPMQ